MTAVPLQTLRDSAVGASWRTLLRISLRELRGGLKGFKIFIACLARALRQALGRQARTSPEQKTGTPGTLHHRG